jgi:AraC-like DNA-binding protein
MSRYSRVLWQGSQMVLGRFRVVPTDRDFCSAGEIGGRPEIAFPRLPVVIHQEGAAPFVADPTLAVLYNPYQGFRRGELGDAGDHSEWLSVDPALLYEASPRLSEADERPFHRTHTRVDTAAFLLVRRVAHEVASGTADPLWVEESLVHVLASCFDTRAQPGSPGARGTARQREWAFEAKAILVTRLGEKLTLTEIARRLGVSPYYLCRSFLAASGETLHAYRTEMRLRTALVRVLERGCDLTAIALDLGFASHSHFTAAFRKRFDTTPSRLRGEPRRVATPRRPSAR